MKSLFSQSQNQLVPIILNLIAALFGALGQYLYKLGGLRLGVVELWQNWQLFVGMALFILVMFLFVLGFKLGGQISVTYPMYATTFVWGTLLGRVLDNEIISNAQVFGILLVVLGIIIVAFFR